MAGLGNRDGDEAWKAHAALVMTQIFNGGYHVITKVALNEGVNQLIFCLYRDVIAFSILAPVAYVRDKRTRPPMTRDLLWSFFVLGLCGIFGNQLLFLMGLKYTNPTYAAAIQPSIPIFTFLLAIMMGTERVNFHRIESQLKIGGTVTCVGGALLMILFRGPTLFGYESVDSATYKKINAMGQIETDNWLSSFMRIGLDDWHLGVLCLIGNCMCMAAYIAFQAPILTKYPASLSVTAYSYFFGVMLIIMAALLMDDKSSNWRLAPSEIYAVIYAGIVTSALNYGLLTWSNKILGPAIVALYNPLQPAASTLLSRIFLGSPIYLGSIIGGALIIGGLYFFTWASYRERQAAAGVALSMPRASDTEPLIPEYGSNKTAEHEGYIFSASSASSNKALD